MNIRKYAYSLFFILIAILEVFLISCSSTPAIKPEELDGTWLLLSINAKPAQTVFEGNLPYLEFKNEREELFGAAGCNKYNAKFMLNDRLIIKDLNSTKAICKEANMEKLYLEILSSPNPLNITLKDSVFSIKDNEENELIFRKFQ